MGMCFSYFKNIRYFKKDIEMYKSYNTYEHGPIWSDVDEYDWTDEEGEGEGENDEDEGVSI